MGWGLHRAVSQAARLMWRRVAWIVVLEDPGVGGSACAVGGAASQRAAGKLGKRAAVLSGNSRLCPRSTEAAVVSASFEPDSGVVRAGDVGRDADRAKVAARVPAPSRAGRALRLVRWRRSARGAPLCARARLGVTIERCFLR
eukprot:6024978-Pleurochrysis_carterae.AAC.2